MRQRFLDHYEQQICQQTTLFPGIVETLAFCDDRGIRWGIVTNKMQRYTLPLLTALGVTKRAHCIVSGDSSPRSKPHPQPMRLAASLCGVRPEQCLYVGDDPRDIAAGQAAGMRSIAARYGYLAPETSIDTWGADAIIDHAAALPSLI